MLDDMLKEFSALPQVEAIALGGSRAVKATDHQSDYDLYIYTTTPIPEETRKEILSKYCSRVEVGNHFWELEDNVILNEGEYADLIYRSIEQASDWLSSVLDRHEAANGYTTCMWYNILHSQCLYDENGRYAQLQKKAKSDYPAQTSRAIMERNLDLLYKKLPNYRDQLFKAVRRNDIVTMNRIASWFMDSYFDLLFALNHQPHPGEKRLIAYALTFCDLLPVDFEVLIESFFSTLFTEPIRALECVDEMIYNLKMLLPPELAE